jgi:hypothetical protein
VKLYTVAETAGTLCGVPGRWMPRHFDADTGRIVSQVFHSASRARGARESIYFEARFDDSCQNGAPDFAITGTVYDPRFRRDSDRGFISGGCIHDAIARCFPEVAPLIRWHLTSARGPMHYVGNTVYMAGDRDHYGLRAGESRQIVGREGPCWVLRIVAEDGTESDLPGPFSNGAQGAEPPPLPGRLEWRPLCRIGAGKPRDLDAARAAAVWPDATDAELMAEPEALRAALEARLPALLDAFRADMTAAGFLLSMPAEG